MRRTLPAQGPSFTPVEPRRAGRGTPETDLLLECYGNSIQLVLNEPDPLGLGRLISKSSELPLTRRVCGRVVLKNIELNLGPAADLLILVSALKWSLFGTQGRPELSDRTTNVSTRRQGRMQEGGRPPAVRRTGARSRESPRAPPKRR